MTFKKIKESGCFGGALDDPPQTLFNTLQERQRERQRETETMVTTRSSSGKKAPPMMTTTTPASTAAKKKKDDDDDAGDPTLADVLPLIHEYLKSFPGLFAHAHRAERGTTAEESENGARRMRRDARFG